MSDNQGEENESAISSLFLFSLCVCVCSCVDSRVLLAGELAYYMYAWNRETVELSTSSLHR